MKNLFSMLCLVITLFACSDDNSEQNASKAPIQDLQMPSSDIPLIENQLVTIQGKGFTSTSQIWLRVSGTKAQGDIQAEVTQANEKSLTFKVPANTIGKKDVILKQDGQEYLLGTLTFKEKERYYTFCYDSDKKELVEIDIESGNLTWNGLKILEFNGSRRGCVFNENGSELVVFDYKPSGKPFLYRLHMVTKEVKEIEVKNLNNASDFDGFIRLNNKYYILCYDKKELVEIDIESGNLTWNGWKISEFNGSRRGCVFNENGSELVVFDDKPSGKPFIYRLNMATKEVKEIEVKNLNNASDFDDFIRLNNKYYILCYDKKELVEIDIESGNLTWNGWKIPEFNGSRRGCVFNENGSELVVFDYKPSGKPFIYRLHMVTKEVKEIEVKNLNNASDFDDMIIRK